MVVYRCAQCNLDLEYDTAPTGSETQCPICGEPLTLDQEGLIAAPASEAPAKSEAAEDPNREKTMIIIGFGMSGVVFFIAVVFGFIRRRITWGMSPEPGSPAWWRYHQEAPFWFTLEGNEAVLLGVAGVFLALSFHLSGYWQVVTGKSYFKHLATLSLALALGFLVAAFAVKGMSH